jgi:hypothetical protein
MVGFQTVRRDLHRPDTVPYWLSSALIGDDREVEYVLPDGLGLRHRAAFAAAVEVDKVFVQYPLLRERFYGRSATATTGQAAST